MLKRSNRIWPIVMVIGLTLYIAGCKGKTEEPSGDQIQIGEFESLTGTTATFGSATHNGIQLAIDQANSNGGIHGKKLVLTVLDDQSKPDQAQNVVSRLINENKVVAILGEVASTRSMAAAPVCQENKVPQITPSSTNPEVTRKGDFIFRVCFTDDFQAAVDAHFAKDQGYKRAAVFKDVKNDYSMAFAKVFTEQFTKLGGQVVANQTYQEGDSDFKAQLNDLKGSNPDVILVPGYYSEVGTIAREAREVGLNVPLLGGDGWDSPILVKGAGGPGGALEGSFFSDHYFSTELTETNVRTFIQAFHAKYNANPDALAALGYDAANLLVDSIKRAKTATGPDIRDAIAQTRDFPGVAGTITIDANRNARKAAVILQIKGNIFHVYKTYTPEQVGQ